MVKFNLPEWRQDKAEADRFFPQIQEIVRRFVGQIIEVRIGNIREDSKECTDYVIEVDIENGKIACRVRKEESIPSHRLYRDITIRSWRANGIRTELEKLFERHVRWYLYCWSIERDITAWVMWDVWKAIDAGILRKDIRVRKNKDGTTGFSVLTIEDLFVNECLVSSSFMVGRLRR